MADVEAMLIKAQNVVDEDLTLMIQIAQDFKVDIAALLQRVPKEME